MTDASQTELGDGQRALFVPLLARARETARKHPLLFVSDGVPVYLREAATAAQAG